MRISKRQLRRLLETRVPAPHEILFEDEDEEQEPQYDVIDADSLEDLEITWIDPRVPDAVKAVIRERGEEMESRCRGLNAYDACVQWMSLLRSHAGNVEMYRGKNDHYWLAVQGGIIDPRGDTVAGWPNVTPDAYEAERIVWRDDNYVDQEILTEKPKNASGIIDLRRYTG